MKGAFQDYTNEILHSGNQAERKNFVVNHKGQIVATMCQIMWCQQTEDAIEEQSPSNPYPLADWHEANLT